jgi:hypothetical protein
VHDYKIDLRKEKEKIPYSPFWDNLVQVKVVIFDFWTPVHSPKCRSWHLVLFLRIEQNYQAWQFNTTPQEALTVAQDVVKTMLARGYILSKDALAKAKAFDESNGLTASAAAKAAELSKRIGLTDRVSAGVGALRSVDETYHVSETTKTVATTTGRTAAKAMNGIVTSSYFSAGAMMVSDPLTRAAKAAADLAAHRRQR